MIAVNKKAEQRAATRLLRQLRIRRVNVDVAGLVVHTSNVSREGAQLVCPAMRFPALQRQLVAKRVELAIEVPTGREVSAVVRIRYACPCDDEFLIGIEFESFRDGDAAGWYAYIDWISNPICGQFNFRRPCFSVGRRLPQSYFKRINQFAAHATIDCGLD